MAEVIAPKHRPSSAPPTAYATTPPPYTRNRTEKDKWGQVARDNATMQKKLAAIRREAPNNFHAPNGYSSLKAGRAIKTQLGGRPPTAMTGVNTHCDVVHWPPAAAPGHERHRRTRMDAIRQENSRIHGKLVSTYRSHGQTPAEQAAGIQPIDCSARWAYRTALYGGPCPGPPSNGARHRSSGTTPRTPSASVSANGVPKCLGVVSCGGCGAKSYFNAGGPRMAPCPQCQQAWYCSPACARVDYSSHKQVCKYETHGLWTPSGTRSRDEYWVSSAAMAAGRRLLRRRRSLGVEEWEEGEVIERAVAEARAREEAAEQLQRRIEKQAYQGLDGPRPCMYMGGEPVARLDARSRRLDARVMPKGAGGRRPASASAGARRSRHVVREPGLDGPSPA